MAETGTQRKLVRVPDVTGYPVRKAEMLLAQAGLQLSAVVYRESYEEKDRVLDQKPQRGQMVYTGEGLVLGISRESYVKWLPSLYQRSDALGRNFVRDLLWIVQHLFGSIEEQLDRIHTYFDSYEAPAEFLPWLASWSALVLEPDWPEQKKRQLIKKALELYRLRGTVRGLHLFISLFTGFQPILRENEWPFPGWRIGVTSAIGLDTVILPPVDRATAFMVVMPHQFKDVTPESVMRLHQIIEMEKPAHTSYMLKFEEPPLLAQEREFFQIGVGLRSGINIGGEIVTPLPPPSPSSTSAPAQADALFDDAIGPTRRPPSSSGPSADLPDGDKAPVEGNEIVSSKYLFEGAREIHLEDIMQELLRQGSAAPSGERKDGE